jgi:DNA-binding MarR family transcriptional regulator
MLLAYRETIGRAYPQRDPISVFKVLEECASPLGTTQIAIAKVTGVRGTEVNKIVGQAAEIGWVNRESRRSSTGAKTVFLTEQGHQMLAEFDRRCLAASTSGSPAPGCENRKRRRESSRAAGQTITLYAFGEQD